MASTKILNISKSDTFEEVFDLFQNADAQEIILIVPKNSKLAKQEAHFTVLKKEAVNSGKFISIMTEDPKVESLATISGIQILAGPSRAKPKLKSKNEKVKILETPEPTPITQDEESYLEEPTPELAAVDEEEPEEYPEVALAAAPIRPNRRTLSDIVEEEPDNTIPVKEEKKIFKVEVKKSAPTKTKASNMDQIEAIWAHQKNTEEYAKRLEPKAKPRRSHSGGLNKKWPAIVIGLAVVIFALVAYVTMGNAKINIQAKRVKADFKVNVVTSPNFSSVDLATGQIPGQQFSVSKEVSDTFPATGQKTVAQKAHGRIQIFNNNLGKEQRLVATTRFESQGGLIFRIPVTITVPGATKTADGKIAPGHMESDVYADKPGPEYNIGPSSFTIPGFKGLPQYNQFSGLSTAVMSGGIIGPAKIVTEEDFAKAQQALEQKLKDAVVSGLKEQIMDLKAIGQDNIKIESPITNAKAGEAADELKMTLKGSINTVAFREADLASLINNHLKDTGGFDPVLSKLTESYENVSLDTASSKMAFTVHVSGDAAAKIDQDKVLADVPGMTQDAVKSYFNGLTAIGSVKIILSPFWVKNIPQDPAKIRLTVE